MIHNFGNGIQDELELLFFEVNALASRLKVAARQLHSENRLPANGRALLQLLARNGPQTVPQLARARATSRQNIQVQIDRFESAGWIQFASNPGHKRSDLVGLTKRGEELLRGALEREANQLAPRLSGVAESDTMASVRLLQKIRAALDSGTSNSASSPQVAFARRRSPNKRKSKAPAPTVAENALEPVSPETDELPINLL